MIPYIICVFAGIGLGVILMAVVKQRKATGHGQIKATYNGMTIMQLKIETLILCSLFQGALTYVGFPLEVEVSLPSGHTERWTIEKENEEVDERSQMELGL